jgi:branched-chain amino acid aminotransferase
VFRVFCCPVGSYYNSPLNIVVTEFDRAAPNGMGSDKVGANYAACLYPKAMAAQDGFGEVLFLDPATHTLLEETSSSNVILRFRGELDLV